MPQLMMRRGTTRMMGPSVFAAESVGAWMAKARPRISRQRMVEGSTLAMSSMMTATQGVASNVAVPLARSHVAAADVDGLGDWVVVAIRPSRWAAT
jgi:hypothetical protein